MLRGLMKRLRKTVTVLMCVLLVVETINCAGMVTNASESVTQTVSNGDAQQYETYKAGLYLLKSGYTPMNEVTGTAVHNYDTQEYVCIGWAMFEHKFDESYLTYAEVPGVMEDLYKVEDLMVQAKYFSSDECTYDWRAGTVSYVEGDTQYTVKIGDINWYVIKYPHGKDKNIHIDGVVTWSEAPAPTATPVPTPEPTATPEPTVKPTATPEPTVKPTATPEPTAEPMVAPTATPEPTAEPTVAPTITPEPTVKPTATPEPTAAPTATPEPTAEPTVAPTVKPTATPEPTVKPTATPEPTVKPTATPEPMVVPTSAPVPTIEPTTAPVVPTAAPTSVPTTAPVVPTSAPTTAPVEPTVAPTSVPTTAPVVPTSAPTTASVVPEVVPVEPTVTEAPGVEPSQAPEPTNEPGAGVPEETEAPIVHIEDGQVPLADSPEVVEIEDEPVALAEGIGECWIHWLILILTLIYLVYEVARIIYRGNVIKKLQAQAEEKNTQE